VPLRAASTPPLLPLRWQATDWLLQAAVLALLVDVESTILAGGKSKNMESLKIQLEDRQIHDL
jgi:hypothetical protein